MEESLLVEEVRANVFVESNNALGEEVGGVEELQSSLEIDRIVSVGLYNITKNKQKRRREEEKGERRGREPGATELGGGTPREVSGSSLALSLRY